MTARCHECDELLPLDGEVHTAHEDDCEGEDFFCRCDALVHARCCRECKPPKPLPAALPDAASTRGLPKRAIS